MYFDRQFALPHLLSLAIALGFLLASARRPRLARKLYAGLFTYASIVNAAGCRLGVSFVAGLGAGRGLRARAPGHARGARRILRRLAAADQARAPRGRSRHALSASHAVFAEVVMTTRPPQLPPTTTPASALVEHEIHLARADPAHSCSPVVASVDCERTGCAMRVETCARCPRFARIETHEAGYLLLCRSRDASIVDVEDE